MHTQCNKATACMQAQSVPSSGRMVASCDHCIILSAVICIQGRLDVHVWEKAQGQVTISFWFESCIPFLTEPLFVLAHNFIWASLSVHNVYSDETF